MRKKKSKKMHEKYCLHKNLLWLWRNGLNGLATYSDRWAYMYMHVHVYVYTKELIWVFMSLIKRLQEQMFLSLKFKYIYANCVKQNGLLLKLEFNRNSVIIMLHIYWFLDLILWKQELSIICCFFCSSCFYGN